MRCRRRRRRRRCWRRLSRERANERTLVIVRGGKEQGECAESDGLSSISQRAASPVSQSVSRRFASSAASSGSSSISLSLRSIPISPDFGVDDVVCVWLMLSCFLVAAAAAVGRCRGRRGGAREAQAAAARSLARCNQLLWLLRLPRRR